MLSGGEETEMADIVHINQLILVNTTVQLPGAPKQPHSFAQALGFPAWGAVP